MGESWRARVARVPDWAWLAGIVVASAALRVWLVRAMPAPFVFVDELIYSELAKSVADAGSFAVRGVPTSGYSTLYPLLLAPAYALFDALPSAYALAKATNAVAMSFAAVPAWLVTRRVAGRGLSLLCAVIAVAIPSMAYTATLVTETLFYPVALFFAWTFLRVLERPSGGRIAVLAAALVAAVATRSQAIGFVGAVVLAPFLLALLRRDPGVLRRFAPKDAAAPKEIDSTKVLERGLLKMDPERHTCTWKGEPVTLTVTEFLILHALAQRPGVVKSRNALMDAAYDDQVYVDDRTIDSHIKRLRKKFKQVDVEFNEIETLYGVGYRYRER